MPFISYGFGCSNVTAPESESALPHPPSVKGAGCSNVTAPEATSPTLEGPTASMLGAVTSESVSYTHLRAHET